MTGSESRIMCVCVCVRVCVCVCACVSVVMQGIRVNGIAPGIIPTKLSAYLVQDPEMVSACSDQRVACVYVCAPLVRCDGRPLCVLQLHVGVFVLVSAGSSDRRADTPQGAGST